MAPLPVTVDEAAQGASARTKLNDAFKEGTSGGVALPAPVALNEIPSVVLDLYEIAFLAGLQVLQTDGLTQTNGVKLPSYTVAGAGTLGATGRTGSMIYVTNESGGAVPAFSDGTNWRRVTDRAIIS